MRKLLGAVLADKVGRLVLTHKDRLLRFGAWCLPSARPKTPKPGEAASRRQLNAIKRSTLPWMLEVTKNAPQMAIIHLGRTFENFFNDTSHYPTFRRKGRGDRFTISNDQFDVEEKRIRIPKLGWVRMRESTHNRRKPKTRARWAWTWA